MTSFQYVLQAKNIIHPGNTFWRSQKIPAPQGQIPSAAGRNSLSRRDKLPLITSDYLPFSLGAQGLPPIPPTIPPRKAGLMHLLAQPKNSRLPGVSKGNRLPSPASLRRDRRRSSKWTHFERRRVLPLGGTALCARERMLRIGNSVRRPRELRGCAAREKPLSGLMHLLAQPKNSLPRRGKLPLITSDYLAFPPARRAFFPGWA